MPSREDGWALLQQIKHSSSSYKQLPVVVLSYSNDRDDITDSYYYGSTSYVTKPMDMQGWIDYIQTLRTYWWETVTLPSDRYMM
jgi:CheY-like chemotaxis protein